MYYYIVQDVIIKSPIILNYPICDPKDLNLNYDILKYSDKIKFMFDYDEDGIASNKLYMYHHGIMHEIIKRLNLLYPHIEKCFRIRSDYNISDVNSKILLHDELNVYNCYCRRNFTNSNVNIDDIKSILRDSDFDDDIINKFFIAFNGAEWNLNWDYDDEHSIYSENVFCKDITKYFKTTISNEKFTYSPVNDTNFWNFINYVYPIHDLKKNGNGNERLGVLADLINIPEKEFNDYYKQLCRLKDKKVYKFDKYSFIISDKSDEDINSDENVNENENSDENSEENSDVNSDDLPFEIIPDCIKNEQFKPKINIQKTEDCSLPYQSLKKSIKISLDQCDKNEILIKKLKILFIQNSIHDPKKYYENNHHFDSKLRKFIEEHTNIDENRIYEIIYNNKLSRYNEKEYLQLKYDFDIKFLEDYAKSEKIDELKEMFTKCIFRNDDKYVFYFQCHEYFVELEGLDIDSEFEVQLFKEKMNRIMIADESDFIPLILNNLDPYDAVIVIADYLGISFNDYRFDIDEMKMKLNKIQESRKLSDEFCQLFIKDDNIKPRQYYNKIDCNYVDKKCIVHFKDILSDDNIDFLDRSDERPRSGSSHRFEEFRSFGLRSKVYKYVYMPGKIIRNKGVVFNWSKDGKYYYPSSLDENSDQNVNSGKNVRQNVNSADCVRQNENKFKNLKRKNKYLSNIIFESSLLMKALEKEYSEEEIYEFKPHLKDEELKMLMKIQNEYDYAKFIYQLITRLKLQIPFNFNPLLYLQCNEVLDLIELISGYRVFKFINDEKYVDDQDEDDEDDDSIQDEDSEINVRQNQNVNENENEYDIDAEIEI